MTRKPYGIKGVTDNPRPPILAKAKIGYKTDEGYPKKLDYIIFVQPQSGEPIEAFAELGEKPTSFLAAFPHDEVESFVDAAWKRYGKSGLKCRGDGEVGIDRETGEERQCAGPYNKEDPDSHLCPFARPTRKNGKTYPPECKPSVSLRLVVPLAGALGLVQLDTGGVASSVPTLWWQIDQLRRTSGDQLAGVAIKVSIRPFTTQHGISYAWQLETPTDTELRRLKEQFARLAPVRVIDRGTVSVGELPPMAESIDQDVYGLPNEALNTHESPGTVEAAESEIPEGGCADGSPPPGDEQPPEVGLPGEVVEAELELVAAMKQARIPPAKRTATERLVEANRAKATELGDFDTYVDWLHRQAARVRPKPEEGAA